jgi:hypothetical protein
MCLCGKTDLDNPLHRCLWSNLHGIPKSIE